MCFLIENSKIVAQEVITTLCYAVHKYHSIHTKREREREILGELQ
jgi:hypothetical protein